MASLIRQESGEFVRWFDIQMGVLYIIRHFVVTDEWFSLIHMTFSPPTFSL
jgi:hypothetical protein